ncbi:hypothetical protein GCM10023147_08840 [Tsukamurella soli]|uniref:Uncharacterized protein n=1 Tax=Tsukamurella soli TaxID=644556 RepID=A0ABP8J6V5_9ACTN
MGWSEWRHSGAAAAVVVTATLITSTGCATAIAGSPVAASSAVPIDGGNYPTQPREIPPFAPGDTADQLRQASLIIAGAVTSPADVDPSLNWAVADVGRGSNVGGLALIDSTTFSWMVPGKLAFDLAAPTFYGGYLVARKDKPGGGASISEGDTADNDHRTVDIGVIRYTSDSDVAGVASALRRDRAATAAVQGSLTGDGLPGHPDAVAVDSDTGQARPDGGSWMVQHGPYLVYVFVGGAATSTKSLAARMVDAQIKRLDNTPIDEQSVSEPASDDERILSYTIPDPSDGAWYYSSRAWLHQFGADWKTDSAKLSQAGVDLVGVGADTVYRAADPQRARALLTATLPTARVVPGGVPGVPGSVCVATRGAFDYKDHYTCGAVRGRYVAVVTGQEQLAAAQQMIGAEYEMLQQAS